MNDQEFHFLLEKLIANEITTVELRTLEKFADSDPVLQETLNKHKAIILGIKSYALQKELDLVMVDRPLAWWQHRLSRWAAVLVLFTVAVILLWPASKSPDELFTNYYEVYPNYLVTRNTSGDILMKGYVAYNNNNFTRAFELIKQSGEYMDDKSPETIFYLGQTQMAIGNYEKSVAYFTDIPENSEYYHLSQWYLSLAYLKTNPQNAKHILNKIVKGNSDYKKNESRKILDLLK